MARIATMLVLATALVACSSGKAAERAATITTNTTTTTSTTTTAPMAAPIPTTTTTTAAAPGGAAESCVRPLAQPLPDRPRYTVRMTVDPAAGTASGDLEAMFTPDVATDRLVLRLWPNAPSMASAGAHETVSAVTVDGVPVTPQQPDPTTVTIAKATPAGAMVRLGLTWALRIAGPVEERVAHDTPASGAWARLGSFLPLLAWEPGVGWATEPPTSAHGEASTFPHATFDVTVGHPAGTQVLASGASGDPDTFHSDAAQDFALSVGPFTTVEGRTASGIPVRVGAVPSFGSSPAPYLAKAIAAIDSYEQRFGPYPWPSYVLALTPHLSGGIEFPGLVMQGPGSIGRSTSHEIGHQWFYGLVGDDQARDPWLDEGLATWAEAGYEGTLASFRSRAIPADAAKRTAEPMSYWSAHRASYYRGVYVQATQALATLGTPAAVDCALADYVGRFGFRIATPGDLVGVLTEHFPDAPAKLARFGIR